MNKYTPEYKIPKVIHFCWFGKGNMSELALKCMKSWKEMLPDYDIKEWNENNFDINSTCEYVKQAYEAKKFAFVSDYVRLKVLYEHGGIYFDTDVEVLKDISGFLSHKSFLCSETHTSVCTGIMAAEQKAVWVKDLLDEYENISFVKKDGTFDTTPNSKRLQNYLEEKYNYHWANIPQELEEEFFIYPPEYFTPLNCCTGVLKKTENTYTIHYFDGSWKKNGLKVKLRRMFARMLGEDNYAKFVRLVKRK